MILINDIWECTRNLKDISNIIREHYNPELANVLDSLLPNHTDEEYEDLQYWSIDEFTKVKNELVDLEDHIGDLRTTVEYLIDVLEKK